MRLIHRMTLGTAFAAVVALAVAPALAQTEIQWWHALTGANNDRVNKLAEGFNKAQSQYKIVATYKGSYAETLQATIAAFRAGNAPHITQVIEVGTATINRRGHARTQRGHQQSGEHATRFRGGRGPYSIAPPAARNPRSSGQLVTSA